MENVEIADKECRFGLYNLALIRIKGLEEVKGKIIPFPEIFQKICRSYSIKKKEAFEILFILRDFDMIEIVPYHGVKIK